MALRSIHDRIPEQARAVSGLIGCDPARPAPAATPRTIIERLNRDVVAILKSADGSIFLIEQGMDPVPSTPEAFGDYIKSEIAKGSKVIEEMGLKGN